MLSDGAPSRLKLQIVSMHYTPEHTGNAPYSTSLAESLARRGHDVSVFAAAPHYPGWRTLPHSQWNMDEVVNGVHVHRVQSYVPAHPGFAKRLIYELLFGLRFTARRVNDADVVLMLSPTMFSDVIVRGWLRLFHKQLPTVVWMQDLYSAGVEETHGPWSRWLSGAVRAIEGSLARSCAAVVVIHERFRDYATRRLGVAPDQIAVIRNWTHVSAARDVNVSEVRRRFGWSEGEVIVLHAGNMGAKQGLDNVIEAARWAESQDMPVRFVLLGDGNQRPSLERQSVGCSRMQFLAPLDERALLETLTAADVLLVNERPGLNESAVPSKLTTYFTTGRPVLAATETTSATAAEVRASGAGSVIRPADPERLVRAALTIHESWGDKAAQAGPAYVNRVLSEEAAVAAFEGLLRRVAQRQGKRLVRNV